MLRALSRLADVWIARRARPDAAARAAVADLAPMVVVTGGSSGIGLAIARRFAKDGHAVALVARDANRLAAAAASMTRDFDVRVVSLPCDVEAEDAAQQIEARLGAERGYVDVLVNCAGTGISGAFADNTPERLEAMLAVNVTALTRLTRHMLPQMLARGRGGILNVSSLGAYAPGPFQAAYYASKAYVLSLTEAIGHETSGRGVRVCAVAPGPVETGFHAAMQAERSGYRLVFPPASPGGVARSAYIAFCIGRRVVVPGIIPTVFMLGARALPHPLLMPLMGLLLAPRRKISNRDNERPPPAN